MAGESYNFTPQPVPLRSFIILNKTVFFVIFRVLDIRKKKNLAQRDQF